MMLDVKALGGSFMYRRTTFLSLIEDNTINYLLNLVSIMLGEKGR